MKKLDNNTEKINSKIGLFRQKFDFTDTEKERKRVLDLVSWMIINKVKGSKIGLFRQKFDFTDTEKERKCVLDLVSWMIINKVKGSVTT